jgi:hypothetical protein
MSNLDTERREMADMLTMIAAGREAHQEAATDERYAKAAANLRTLANTMRDVPDELLMRIANLDVITDGLLSSRISAKLCAIGFEIDAFDNATAFYQSFVALI